MLITIFAALISFAQAEPTQTIRWPNSKVVCGGTVDGQQLDMRISIKNEVITADSERFIVYIDLHKPGQVHWLIAEVLSDADYELREKIAAKLSQEDADAIRAMTSSRQTELHAGMINGIANLSFSTKNRKLSLSCQETKLQEAAPINPSDLESALQPIEEPANP